MDFEEIETPSLTLEPELDLETRSRKQPLSPQRSLPSLSRCSPLPSRKW